VRDFIEACVNVSSCVSVDLCVCMCVCVSEYFWVCERVCI